MDIHIKEVAKRLSQALDDVNKYTKALKVLQDICDHAWVYDGHGHNRGYYKCDKCGLTKDE